jgi:hypothetical protein
MPQKITDSEFISVWSQAKGSPTVVAKLIGMTESNVYRRRRELADKGVTLKTIQIKTTSSGVYGWDKLPQQFPLEASLSIDTGKILCISDAHYWPGIITTAHIAAVEFAKQERPAIIAALGDMFDGATVSRHPPLGWEKSPRVIDELDACRDRMSDFERASPESQRVWHVGNHDARFDRTLAANTFQYEGLAGFSIADYFKSWNFTYMSKVNNQLGMRHRPVNGGVHSGYNSALKYGLSYAHGHLHQLRVAPVDNAHGRLWGVDCGHLAEPGGPQFAYREGLTIGACSGFAVLSFIKGRIVDAEICHVNEMGAVFRGELIVSSTAASDDSGSESKPKRKPSPSRSGK